MFKQLLVILIAWSIASQAFAREGSVPVRKEFHSTSIYEQLHHRSDPDRNFNNNWNAIGNVTPDVKHTNPSRSRLPATPSNNFFYAPADSIRQSTIPTSGTTQIFSTRQPVIPTIPTSDTIQIVSTRRPFIPTMSKSGTTQIVSLKDSYQTTYEQNNRKHTKYWGTQDYNFDTELMTTQRMNYEAQRLFSQPRQQLSLLNTNKNQSDKNDEFCISIFLTQTLPGCD